MAIDRHGNLVLSCPNYAEDAQSGVVVRIDRQGNVTKWFDVPAHPETGVARNMGIAFDDDWNIYLCDNQGWSERPELIYKGRILKLTVTDGLLTSCVYRFALDDEGIEITNTLDDPHLQGNLYIADFSANAICMVHPDGRVERIAQSPDCTGLDGGLDQPGEPIVWEGRLIISCFDLVTGPDKVNTKHEMPATLVQMPLPQ